MAPPASPGFLRRAHELLPADADGLLAAARELPPIAVVGRIVVVVARAASDPRAGRLADAGAIFAAELEAIAVAIATLWGSRGDWTSLALRLTDRTERAELRAVSATAAVRDCDRDGWEPMEDVDLGAVVARDAAVGALEALDAYPPLGLWAGSLACAVLLRAAEPDLHLQIVPVAPHARSLDSGLHRALVLASLARLRGSVEAAFPGVAGRFAAPPAARKRSAAGPYRASPAIEGPTEAPRRQDIVERDPVHAALASSGLDELLERARLHALRAGLSDRASRRAGGTSWLGLLREEEKALEQRAMAERAALGDVRAACFQRVVGAAVFPVMLHEAVVELHAAAGALAVEDRMLADPVVAGLTRCSRALAAVRALLGLGLGLDVGGDESTLAAAAVAGRIAHPGPRGPTTPYESLVQALARVLEGTSFAALHRSLAPTAREIDDAERGAAAADARVHWYERLRVLGDSPAVVERDAHVHEAAEQRHAFVAALGAVRGYLEGALRTVHPQALVYFATYDLEAALGRVRVAPLPLLSSRHAEHELEGDTALRDHLQRWTGELLRAFGDVPSPGGAALRYAAAELARFWPSAARPTGVEPVVR